MRRLSLLVCLALFCAGPVFAGFSLGRPGAVKKRVEKLDDKVKAELAAAAAPASPSGNNAPVVVSLTAVSTTVAAGGLARLTVSASDPDGDSLSYVWSSTAGTLSGTGASVYWLAPPTPGVYTITCVVSDGTDTSPGTRQVKAVPPGTLKWSFTPSNNANLPLAAAADGTLYAVTTDAKLYAVNPDGTQKWVFSTESNDMFNFGPVVAADGTVYVVAADTKTYAISPSGTLVWGGPSPFFPSVISNPPVIGGDGSVYLYDGNTSELNVLDPLTGAGQSTFTALSGLAGPPVINDDGAINIVDSADMLYSVPPSGVLGSAVTLDVTGISPPLVPGPGGVLYLVKNGTDLYALKPDRTDKWAAPYVAAAGIADVSIGTDGAVYLLDNAPALHKVAAADGAGAAFPALGSPSYPPSPGPDSGVYAVDADTDLYGVGADGVADWGPVNLPGSASIVSRPVAVADGTLYFPADDGNLYALYSTSVLP